VSTTEITWDVLEVSRQARLQPLINDEIERQLDGALPGQVVNLDALSVRLTVDPNWSDAEIVNGVSQFVAARAIAAAERSAYERFLAAATGKSPAELETARANAASTAEQNLNYWHHPHTHYNHGEEQAVLDALSLHLSLKGVLHELLRGGQIVIVASQGGGQLNRLAFRLMLNYGVRLLYLSPRRPDQKARSAGYAPGKLDLYIDRETLIAGVPSPTLVHEIRHVDLTHSRHTSATDFYSNIDVRSLRDDNVIVSDAKSGYGQGKAGGIMTFQESEATTLTALKRASNLGRSLDDLSDEQVGQSLHTTAGMTKRTADIAFDLALVTARTSQALNAYLAAASKGNLLTNMFAKGKGEARIKSLKVREQDAIKFETKTAEDKVAFGEQAFDYEVLRRDGAPQDVTYRVIVLEVEHGDDHFELEIPVRTPFEEDLAARLSRGGLGARQAAKQELAERLATKLTFVQKANLRIEEVAREAAEVANSLVQAFNDRQITPAQLEVVRGLNARVRSLIREANQIYDQLSQGQSAEEAMANFGQA
jgi:hypothetical protein